MQPCVARYPHSHWTGLRSRSRCPEELREYGLQRTDGDLQGLKTRERIVVARLQRLPANQLLDGQRSKAQHLILWNRLVARGEITNAIPYGLAVCQDFRRVEILSRYGSEKSRLLFTEEQPAYPSQFIGHSGF